jgi:hypothetical protein
MVSGVRFNDRPYEHSLTFYSVLFSVVFILLLFKGRLQTETAGSGYPIHHMELLEELKDRYRLVYSVLIGVERALGYPANHRRDWHMFPDTHTHTHRHARTADDPCKHTHRQSFFVTIFVFP